MPPQAPMDPWKPIQNETTHQELLDIARRQSNPRVVDHQRRRTLVGGDRFKADRRQRAVMPADRVTSVNGVHGVLQWFPQINRRRTVEMVGENVDQPAQIDLKVL